MEEHNQNGFNFLLANRESYKKTEEAIKQCGIDIKNKWRDGTLSEEEIPIVNLAGTPEACS
ncbi:hypothetical protein [Pajaroellobacter abortibovis]|uniref:Uncharacterized protein n=1 Tax=Pajaroellobacter abortibovis TaxID=1882918 RepID=A0A1L6MWM8_9BACT|nr:hypothetical protein [Pajaroellobacter abortibovis]APR99864.1 hypothetical protein BCY86_03610 [Pajaroellobacter abortibovis]